MANRRLSMRKIKEVLRLSYQGNLSARQVAHSLNISRSAVKEYQERAKTAGLGWPLPDTLSEHELEQKLFPPPRSRSKHQPKRCRTLSISTRSLRATRNSISPWIFCGRSTKNNIP